MPTRDRSLRRDEFLRGTAGLVAAGTGMGLLAPSAFARGQVKKGGVLRYVFTETIAGGTTDLSASNADIQSLTLSNTYQRLTYIELNTWRTVPQLAESWSVSPDSKTWTFKLRKGVKFHNGKTLDSKDVAWSYRHVLDPKTGSNIQGPLSAELDPSGISTPKSDTVVFRLKKPDAFFPLFTGAYQMSIWPAGVNPAKQPIGTGPFMIKSWNPTRAIEVVRNPHYWKPGLPYLDGARFVYIADQVTKTQAVLSGTAQLSDRIPYTQLPAIKKNTNLRLYVLPGGSFPVYTFDLLQEPFTDPRVPQAIKLAVNRRVILQAAIQGNGTLTGDVPELPNDTYYPKQRGVPGPEIATAKQLLKAAGHGDGLAFTLHTSDVYPGLPDMSVALKETVAPAGITVTIQKDSPDTYFSDVWLKAAAVTSYWTHRHPAQALTLMYRSSAAWNESHFRNKQLDNLIDLAGATVNAAKQRAALRTALNMVATQSGVGIGYFINNIYLAKKNVIGFQPDPRAVSLERTWLA